MISVQARTPRHLKIDVTCDRRLVPCPRVEVVALSATLQRPTRRRGRPRLLRVLRYLHSSGHVAVEGVHDLRDDAGTDYSTAYLVRLPGADRAWAVDPSGVVRIPVWRALHGRAADGTRAGQPRPGSVGSTMQRAHGRGSEARDEDIRRLVITLLPDFLDGSPAIFEESASCGRRD